MIEIADGRGSASEIKRSEADAILAAVPENAFRIAQTRPNTWLAGLPGCGHNMINEQPEELRRLIVGFIQARSGASK